MTTPRAFDAGLELFIMERQLVLHEEADSRRRRRRVLRVTGGLVIAGALASGTGLAAAGTAPLPAAESAIDFLFPGGTSSPGSPEPTTVTPPAPVGAPAPQSEETPSSGDAQSHQQPATASDTTSNAPSTEPSPVNNATGHGADNASSTSGNSGARGKPSPPPGQSAKDNPKQDKPSPRGQQKK